jgi:predicted ferric reductase
VTAHARRTAAAAKARPARRLVGRGRRRAENIAWLALYVTLVALPFLALAIGTIPTGVSRRWDFAIAVGYGAVALFGMQFLLTARFKLPAAPFGIDLIYYFHCYLAIVAVALVLIHVVALFAGDSRALLRLLSGNLLGYMGAGVAALVIFIAVVVASVWRRPLGIGYHPWRLTHALLAVAGYVGMIVHVAGSGYYLHEPWRRALWLAFVLVWLALIAYVRMLRPLQLAAKPYRVADVRDESDVVRTLVLEPDGHAGLEFEPGQFAWLTLRSSPFAMREHPFSIASSATDSQRLEFSIKERGPFTRMVANLKPGEQAYVDGPYGSFTTDRYPDAESFVFIAGGIGIAPIIGILRTLAARAERRALYLIYGNNLLRRAVFRTELDALAQQLNLRVVHVIGEPPEDWQGERGLITKDLLRKHLPNPLHGAEFFICGPNDMKRNVENVLRSFGVRVRAIHSEIFDLA